MLHMLKPVEAIGSLKAKPRRQYMDIQLPMSSCVKHIIPNGMLLVIKYFMDSALQLLQFTVFIFSKHKSNNKLFC